ncbi:hypothetical protein [Sorangium sp. So ce542]|uniref:hypothetical protein n=1 Tax=Sorangium sp. So ce542 TaxID=3133316 RepID=UPI003F64521C
MSGTGANARAQIVLQRAYQVLFHLEQCDHLEQAARSQFNAHARSVTELPDELHGWSPVVAGLIIELSGAMGALRILQNDVWALAAGAAGARNSPSSMRDAYKSIAQKYVAGSKRPRWLAEVPVDVRRAVAAYWESSGERAATYRDVDQHHDVLARGCFLITEGGTVRKVSIRLPDNPEQKSRARFDYVNKIDGIDLVRDAFTALHGLVEELARLGGASPAPLLRTVDFTPSIEHKAGIARTTGILLFDSDGRTGLVIGQDEELHATIRRVTV